MPLYTTLAQFPDIVVYLWKVEESESELLLNIDLTQNSKDRYLNMCSSMHRRGFLSIRHLLKHAGYEDSELIYDKLGKPHLSDGTFISITHSFEFTGIIVSKTYPVGIDIERHREKILRISRRFVSAEEDLIADNERNKIIHLTRIWSAKEAIYKIMAVPGLRFLDQIRIDTQKFIENKTRGQVVFEGRMNGFSIFFIDFEGYTLGYALKE